MVQGIANVLSSVSRCGEVEAHVTYGALLGRRIMSKALSKHVLTISYNLFSSSVGIIAPSL